MARFAWQGEVETIMVAEEPGVVKRPELETVDVSLGKGGVDYVDEVSSLTKQLAAVQPDFQLGLDRVVAKDLGLLGTVERLLLQVRGLVERREFQEALEVLHQVLREDAEHQEARFLLGYCHDELEEPEEALLALRGLADRLFHGQVGQLREKIRSRMLGDLMAENLSLARAGQIDQAVQRLREVIGIDPDVGMYHFMLAGTLMMADRLEEAREAAENGLEHTKGDDRRRLADLKATAERRMLERQMAPARAHYRKGNYPRARSALDRLEPRYRETSLFKTFRTYLEELGGGLFGLRAGKPVISVRPRGRFKEVDALHFFLVGEETGKAKLLMALGGFAPAAGMLESALRYAPHFPYAHFLKGNCLYHLVLGAFAAGEPPPIDQATGLLEEALDHVKQGAKDKEIEGAPDLLEGIEGALKALAEVRRELEAQAAEMATVNGLARALVAIRDSVGEGIRSPAHYREIVDRMNGLDREIRAARRTVSRDMTTAALEHLDGVVQANLKQLRELEGQVEEAEEIHGFMEEFASIMKSVEEGISSEPQHREVDQSLTSLQSRVRAARRKLKDVAAAKAMDDLAEAIDRNCQQLQEADQLRKVMEEFSSIMQRAKGGIESESQAGRFKRELEGVRDRAQQLTRQLKSDGAREQLKQLTEAIDRNLGQLDGILRGSAEAEPVREIVERFNSVMQSVEGGIRSRYQLDEFRSEIEKLATEVPQLFTRMRSPSAKETLGQLMMAILKVKEQLDKNR